MQQAGLCPVVDECPDKVYRCRNCGYSLKEEPGNYCPGCTALWKFFEVSHGPGCPKNQLADGMDSTHGALIRRCFRLLNAKTMGLSVTMADITEEEFRVMELIDSTRHEITTEQGLQPKAATRPPQE